MGSWPAKAWHAGEAHGAEPVPDGVGHGSDEHGVEGSRDARHAVADGPREGAEHRSHAAEHPAEHPSAAVTAVAAVRAGVRGGEGDAGREAEGEERRRRPHLDADAENDKRKAP